MKRFSALLFCLISITGFSQEDPFLEDLGVRKPGNSSKVNVEIIDKLNKGILTEIRIGDGFLMLFLNLSYGFAFDLFVLNHLSL